MHETVTRTDFLELFFSGPEPEKLKTTDEGFLQGVACVTNIGIFPYLLPDGTIRRELRLPEEVFHPDSLASLKGKPLTDEHPEEGVNPQNVTELAVGALGTEITHDDLYVYAPLTFWKQDTVDKIKAGKRALSCGYRCRLDFVSGTKWGQQYDCIQREIRYNHTSLVDKGRAGEDAVLRMDGSEYRAFIPTTPHNDRSTTVKTIHLDNVAYQADEAVIAALQGAQKEAKDKASEIAKKDEELKASADTVASLQKTKDELQAQLDTCNSKLKQAEEDAKKQCDELPAKIDEAVKGRLAMLDTAKAQGVEVTADMTADAIQTAVIAKAFPELSLDGVSADYKKACYDAAIGAKRQDSGRQGSLDVPSKDNQDGAQGSPVAAAQKKHDAALCEAWKN